MLRKTPHVLRYETQAFATLYSEILENGAPAFETIFKHIRDNPGSACLVHCTGNFQFSGSPLSIFMLTPK